MMPESNQKQIDAVGLSVILSARIPHVPYVTSRWRREHPGEDIGDGQISTQPWLATRPDFYQVSAHVVSAI